jgi:peptidoglycan/LPS O-acetylase OafA/YrhL
MLCRLTPVQCCVERRAGGCYPLICRGTLILEHERQHYVGLDLLRGVAAYGVILAHLHVAISRGVGFNVEPIITGFLGRAGVEVFFALSGFLIGGILCDLRERTAANYGIFLVRRWMRTLPLYYVAVWFFFAYPGIFEPQAPHKLWQYLTFTQNFTGQRDLTWFNVSWTLAVEEWFYALLTVSVAFATLTLRLKNGFVCAVAFLIVLGISIRAASPMWGGLGVIGRLDAIAYGCLLAWLVRHPVIGPRLYGKRALVCVAAVLGIYATWIMERYGVLYWSRFNLVFHYVLWGVTAAGVVYAFYLWRPTSPALVRVAAFAAAVSYPIYIWHQAVMWIFWQSRVNESLGLLHAALVILLASAIAYAMHIAIEQPFMAWRPRFRTNAKPVPQAVAVAQ